KREWPLTPPSTHGGRISFCRGSSPPDYRARCREHRSAQGGEFPVRRQLDAAFGEAQRLFVVASVEVQLGEQHVSFREIRIRINCGLPRRQLLLAIAGRLVKTAEIEVGAVVLRMQRDV